MIRTRPISLPPAEALPTSVRKVYAEHVDLTRQQLDAAAALLVLEDARRAAVDADRVAYSKALREGKSDPGTPQTDKIDTDMAEQRRLVAALTQAVEDVTAEVTRAIDAARPAWQARLSKTEADARTKYQQAVDNLDAARTALVEVTETAAWLANPAPKLFKISSPPLRLLRSQSGDPTAWAAVVHALRGEHPDPPAPGVPVATVLAAADMSDQKRGGPGLDRDGAQLGHDGFVVLP